MATERERLVGALRKQLGRVAQGHADLRAEVDKAEQLALNAADEPRNPDDGAELEPPATEDALPGDADWARLARMTGIPPSGLKKRVPTPFECKLVVSREQPQTLDGQRVPCGEFPEFGQNWPFDLAGLKDAIAERYGGELWRLSIQDSGGRVIRDLVFRLAIPPHEPGAELPAGDALPGVSGAIEEVGATVPPDELDAAMQDICATERTRYRAAALRKARLDVEKEMSGGSSADAKLDQVIRALSDRGHDNGNGQMAVLLQAMQSQATQQSESLKLVLASIGDKLSHSQDSQGKMFEMMARMIDSRSGSQAEIAKIQMESKRSEMDLLMKMVTERREERDMGLDRMLEIFQMGMNIKSGEREGGEEKGDWLTTLVSGLANVITNQATAQVKVGNPAALPGAAPPSPAEMEAQRAEIERMATEAARKIAFRAKARQDALRRRASAQAAGRGPAAQAPPPQPAPPAAAPEQRRFAEWRTLVSDILELAVVELGELPERSEAVQLAYEQAPREWCEFLVTHDSAMDIARFFKPYADEALLAQVQQLLKDSAERQTWLMTQGSILRNALVKAHNARVAASQPPPAPEPDEVPEVAGAAEEPKGEPMQGGPANA